MTKLIVGSYVGTKVPQEYPITIVSYHHRWWGRPLLRLAWWLERAAYWKARRVEDVIEGPPVWRPIQ